MWRTAVFATTSVPGLAAFKQSAPIIMRMIIITTTMIMITTTILPIPTLRIRMDRTA